MVQFKPILNRIKYDCCRQKRGVRILRWTMLFTLLLIAGIASTDNIFITDNGLSVQNVRLFISNWIILSVVWFNNISNGSFANASVTITPSCLHLSQFLILFSFLLLQHWTLEKLFYKRKASASSADCLIVVVLK